MINKYDVGTVVTLSAAFTIASNSAPVDPTTVIVRVRTPDGNVQTFTPEHDSVGAFSYNFQTTQAGYHYYRFEGSGNLNAPKDGTFITVDSPTLD